MSNRPVRVGLIGLGAIGAGVVDLAYEHHRDEMEIVAALVRNPSGHDECRVPRIVTAVTELLDADPDLVIEAGGHDALRAHGPAILKAGCDLFLVSVGALADDAFMMQLQTIAEENECRIRVMSGAIGALDALGAAAVGGLESVIHITRKPPRSLLDAADAEGLDSATEVFRGSAREGASSFPESINVAAAVSLAGIGLDRTQVVVMADPAVDHNQHEVEAKGVFGSLHFAISNVPNERNPKSTKLVAMSIVRKVLEQRSVLTVG